LAEALLTTIRLLSCSYSFQQDQLLLSHHHHRHVKSVQEIILTPHLELTSLFFILHPFSIIPHLSLNLQNEDEEE